MILDCLFLQELNLPQWKVKVAPYGEALVFVKTAELQQMGIVLTRNPLALAMIDAAHPLYAAVTPVWVRIVEKCEDGTYLGFQTDLRSRPFGIRVREGQFARFFPRKTLVAA